MPAALLFSVGADSISTRYNVYLNGSLREGAVATRLKEKAQSKEDTSASTKENRGKPLPYRGSAASRAFGVAVDADSRPYFRRSGFHIRPQ